MGRGVSRVQAFWPQAKTLPQAEFTSAEDEKKEGAPAEPPGSVGIDLPWSMWAMIEKFLILDWSVMIERYLLKGSPEKTHLTKCRSAPQTKHQNTLPCAWRKQAAGG